MSTEANKASVRRYLDEVFHGRDPAVVDELVAPNFIHHDPVNPLHGPAGLKQYQAVLFAAFPDLRLSIDDMVAEGDKVAVRYTVTGTHLAELAGIAPTGA
jgi:predicted ester cyclase